MGKLAMGLDIGTTTLSAAVVDLATGAPVKTYTLKNESALPERAPYEKMQDAHWILKNAEQLTASAAEAFALSAIGITGQMHGIVYVDEAGDLLSPLYTWQDERAGQACAPGQTYCDEIFEKTGQRIFPGYGLATHYYQMKNGLVPSGAAAICTVMDALVLALTGQKRPLLHSSNAASLGLYDGEKGLLYGEALEKLGMDLSIIPGVIAREMPVGVYQGIPVCCAIGDNQASVFGTLAEEETGVLVNFGTGSQVSLITEKYTEVPALESRPYLFGKFLLSGAALCGGRAYAMVERFFRQYASALGVEGEQYALMQQLAEQAYGDNASLQVNTTFCGTRMDPALRGSVTGIGEDNFAPGHMILGVLRGMAEELFSMYEKMPRQGRSMLAASGNGVRKNPMLQRVLKDRFQMPLLLPGHQEEAAFGAALYAAVVSGAASFSDAKACIAYAEM